MGRVGDGGGLRLEKERETGEGTGVAAEPSLQDTDIGHHAHAVEAGKGGHTRQ